MEVLTRRRLRSQPDQASVRREEVETGSTAPSTRSPASTRRGGCPPPPPPPPPCTATARCASPRAPTPLKHPRGPGLPPFPPNPPAPPPWHRRPPPPPP